MKKDVAHDSEKLLFWEKAYLQWKVLNRDALMIQANSQFYPLILNVILHNKNGQLLIYALDES